MHEINSNEIEWRVERLRAASRCQPVVSLADAREILRQETADAKLLHASLLDTQAYFEFIKELPFKAAFPGSVDRAWEWTASSL